MHKSTSDKVSFQVTPEDAVISVYDKDGERLTPSVDSLMVYETFSREKPIPGIFLNMAIFPGRAALPVARFPTLVQNW